MTRAGQTASRRLHTPKKMVQFHRPLPKQVAVNAIFVAALAAVMYVLAAAGCQHPLPPPAPPAQVDAASPYGDGGASCSSACENIFALGCQDKATKCVAACELVQASGVFTIDVGCITRALYCAAVDACQAGQKTGSKGQP